MSPFSFLPQPFSRHEALRTGITATALSAAITAGLLIRLGSGLYAVRSPWEVLAPWRHHHLLSLAAARLTPDAVLSHASNAAALGLPHPAYPPSRVTMTLLGDARTSRRHDWRQFHRGETPHDHIELNSGRARTTPTRTVVDCARELHGRDALAIADGALRCGSVTEQALFAMRSHQRRWPRITKMDRVLLLADGRRENWLESASAWSMAAAGLPAPIPQVEVFGYDGEFLARVDNLWPDLGVVGEADGLGKYLLDGATDEGVTRAVSAERERESRLERRGLTVVRWTTAESITGDAIATQVAPHLMGPHPRIRAIFRCSCCKKPLKECDVDARLAAFRRVVAKSMERKFW